MMNIDNINLIFTIISIVVTIISIVFSIWAFISAKKTKQYKDDTMALKETLDLESIHGKFLIESKYFMDKTRCDSWFKGNDVNSIITPFVEVLHSFGKIYHLVKSKEDLKDKVHRLNEIVQDYDKAKKYKRKECRQLVLEITETLQTEIHRNYKNTIKR